MAERKGSGGDGDGHEPVESGQQDDRARVEDEREVPRGDVADDETELDEAELSEHDTDGERSREPADVEGTADAEIIAFRGRAHDSVAEETDSDEEPDDEELADLGEEPVDLSAVQADDELLDALGGTDPELAGERTEPDLDVLLVAWRQDVDAAPIGDLVDTDTAVAAIAEGSRVPRRRKRRHLVPVATAAAVLMITFTGVGVAARDAMPGDALWGVTQVLYTDYARSAQAASTAQEQLDKASTAWENGRSRQAEAALRRAHEQMRTVEAAQGLSDLRAAHRSLSAKFERTEETSESSSSQPTSSSQLPPPSPTHQPSPTVPPSPPSPSQPPTTTPSAPTTSPDEPSNPTTTPSPPSRTSGSTSSGSGSSPWSSTEDSGGLFPP